jgi:hypothetical protein
VDPSAGLVRNHELPSATCTYNLHLLSTQPCPFSMSLLQAVPVLTTVDCRLSIVSFLRIIVPSVPPSIRARAPCCRQLLSTQPGQVCSLYCHFSHFYSDTAAYLPPRHHSAQNTTQLRLSLLPPRRPGLGAGPDTAPDAAPGPPPPSPTAFARLGERVVLEPRRGY